MFEDSLVTCVSSVTCWMRLKLRQTSTNSLASVFPEVGET